VKVPGAVPSAGKIFAYALSPCCACFDQRSLAPQRVPYDIEKSGFPAAEPENFTSLVGI
jgi:hypothetical protein